MDKKQEIGMLAEEIRSFVAAWDMLHRLKVEEIIAGARYGSKG